MSSPPPDTRKGMMSQAEVDKVVEGIFTKGARIEMKDARFTTVQTWLWGILGTAAVTGIGVMVVSMVDLNRNVALLVQQNLFKDRLDAQQDKHMESQDLKIDQQDIRLRYLERFHNGDAPRNSNGR